MFISIAHASEGMVAVAPNTADMFWTNMGLIGLMFVLFYFLMIRPQQKRMQEQRSMLGGLQKGDEVVTGGGLVGTISKVISDDQVEVDLGSVKVTAMRYTLQTSLSANNSAVTNAKPVNDSKVDTVEKEKTEAKKKTTARKKAPAKAPAKAKKTTDKKKA